MTSVKFWASLLLFLMFFGVGYDLASNAANERAYMLGAAIITAAVCIYAGFLIAWFIHSVFTRRELQRHERAKRERIAEALKPSDEPRVRRGSDNKPVMETSEGRLFRVVFMEDTCPDCNHIGFLGGPSGGMSQNIFCKNAECRSGFNVTAFSATQGLCERIGKGDLDRYTLTATEKLAIRDKEATKSRSGSRDAEQDDTAPAFSAFALAAAMDPMHCGMIPAVLLAGAGGVQRPAAEPSQADIRQAYDDPRPAAGPAGDSAREFAAEKEARGIPADSTVSGLENMCDQDEGA